MVPHVLLNLNVCHRVLFPSSVLLLYSNGSESYASLMHFWDKKNFEWLQVLISSHPYRLVSTLRASFLVLLFLQSSKESCCLRDLNCFVLSKLISRFGGIVKSLKIKRIKKWKKFWANHGSSFFIGIKWNMCVNLLVSMK